MIFSALCFGEPLNVLKMVFIFLILIGIAGFKNFVVRKVIS